MPMPFVELAPLEDNALVPSPTSELVSEANAAQFFYDGLCECTLPSESCFRNAECCGNPYYTCFNDPLVPSSPPTCETCRSADETCWDERDCCSPDVLCYDKDDALPEGVKVCDCGGAGAECLDDANCCSATPHCEPVPGGDPTVDVCRCRDGGEACIGGDCCDEYTCNNLTNECELDIAR
jgi:hypothetical protein